MEPAFWDSSSIVPLCVIQHATPARRSTEREISNCCLVVRTRGDAWCHWRLVRIGQLTPNQHTGRRQVLLDNFAASGAKISPSEKSGIALNRLVDRFPLQCRRCLPACCGMGMVPGHPHNRPFISGDKHCSTPPGNSGSKESRLNRIECEWITTHAGTSTGRSRLASAHFSSSIPWPVTAEMAWNSSLRRFAWARAS